MKHPDEGELTTTEQQVYDLVADIDPSLVPTTAGLARRLKKDEELVAGACDGLEAMGFIRKYGGVWNPDYRD